MQLISQGAEAHLYLEGNTVLKRRVSKSYRISELDHKLRLQRTRSEGKLLQKAVGLTPKLLSVDEKQMTLTLEYLEGPLLKTVLDTLSDKERHRLLIALGKQISQLHQQHIIHGDLTTSNIIVHNNTPYLIDFGLGYISLKPEDKAVDLHLLKHALLSKHFSVSEIAFVSVLEGYATYPEHRTVLQRLEKVEKRGRYKQKQS